MTERMPIGTGVPARRAWLAALSGKGWWRRSHSPPMQEGLLLAVILAEQEFIGEDGRQFTVAECTRYRAGRLRGG